MKAVVVRRRGGPEVLELEKVPIPQPGEGEVRVALRAIGVNGRDALIRAGVYRRDLPLIPGIEAAGVVNETGPGVAGWKPGDRVAYYVPDRLGAYADYQAVPAGRLVALPDALSFEDAAAVFDHGLTAHYLTETTFPVAEGQRILVHGAAGGVASLVLQRAKRRGAAVYGTVSSREKADHIKALGADAAILYRETNVVEAVRILTGGEGVDAVYDSVGRDTIDASIRCLRKRGMLVLYGQSSGPVEAISPAALADHGSLYFTRPHLLDHVDTPEELARRSRDVFDWFSRGEIAFTIDRIFPLAEAAAAHRRLAERSRLGKILLVP